MSALKLSFIIEAIDRATAPVRAINERIERVTEPVRKVRASFNQLLQESHLPKLASQAKVVMEKFDGVTSSLRGIAGGALIVAGAAAAMWFPLKHVIDAGSKVNDTAAMLGVSAREYQRLAYALTLDGSSAEDAATAMRFLQRNAVEALSNNKEMAIWFRRAGISADFLRKNLRDPTALLYKLSDGMAKNITPAQRLAISQALLGRSSSRTVQTLARGSAALRELGDEAERLGAVMDDKTVAAMDDAGDSITRMERALGGVMNRITSAALPAIEKIVGRVTEWAVANRELIASRVAEYAERLIQNLPQIAETTMRVVGAIGSMITAADAVARAIGGWQNVMALVVGIMIGKAVIAVISLGSAIAALTPTIATLGAVLLASPIGWFLGIVALLAAAAYLVYKNWEPIKQFFVDLWETIKQTILQIDAATPEWIKKYTVPGMALSAAASAVRPSAAPIGAASAAGAAGGADVSGTINIKIDQDGRARVAAMQSDNRGVDFDIDSGPLFLGVGA